MVPKRHSVKRGNLVPHCFGCGRLAQRTLWPCLAAEEWQATSRGASRMRCAPASSNAWIGNGGITWSSYATCYCGGYFTLQKKFTWDLQTLKEHAPNRPCFADRSPVNQCAASLFWAETISTIFRKVWNKSVCVWQMMVIRRSIRPQCAGWSWARFVLAT